MQRGNSVATSGARQQVEATQRVETLTLHVKIYTKGAFVSFSRLLSKNGPGHEAAGWHSCRLAFSATL